MRFASHSAKSAQNPTKSKRKEAFAEAKAMTVKMSSTLKKHKLLFILIPAAIAIIVGAFIGISHYRKVTEINALVEQGNRYLSVLDYDQAAAYYRQALQIDAKDRGANLALADCYERAGKTDLAEDVYRSLLSGSHPDAEAVARLAEIYMREGDHESAKDLLERYHDKADSDEVDELYRLTHPEKPVFETAAGEYSERIALEISCAEGSDGTIYYTLDGSEPSTESEVCVSPVILPNGSTTVKAVTVNQAGFMSETAEGGYTINIADKEVVPSDETVEDIIRDDLEIPQSDPINNDDIEKITSFCAIGSGYHSVNGDANVVFDGNGYSVSGNYYSIYEGSIHSLEDLADLPFLETLVVAYQKDLDISSLSKATGLKRLSLIGNHLDAEDIRALSTLDGLEDLCLGWNDIDDISALSALTGLHSLALWGNRISDISAVKGLSGLTYLDISENRVTDLSAVSGLSSLEELWMYSNSVSSVSPLSGLQSLNVLMLRDNPISDAESLRPIYPRLERLDEDLLGTEEEQN